MLNEVEWVFNSDEVSDMLKCGAPDWPHGPHYIEVTLGSGWSAGQHCQGVRLIKAGGGKSAVDLTMAKAGRF